MAGHAGAADVLLVSGGSSVGQEDHAPRLLARHGELAIHGIAMRPSSPAGMGRLSEKVVFLLPGNPVSCLWHYDFFAGRAIRMAAGLPPDWPYRRATLPLRRKLVSVVGRVDYARVAVADGGGAFGNLGRVDPEFHGAGRWIRDRSRRQRRLPRGGRKWGCSCMNDLVAKRVAPLGRIAGK